MSQSTKDKLGTNEGTSVPFLVLMPKIELSDLQDCLLNSQLSEIQHVKNIEEMTKKFTSNRKQIGDYVLNENLVSSYAYFYLPTNVPKFYFLMDQLPTSLQDKILNSNFIDIGCGPGTYSYAYLSLKNTTNEIYCLDSSQMMLDQAKKILNGKFPNAKIKFEKRIDKKIDNSVLFFGNSINEIGIQNALDMINVISPEFVIFIEPGTSELFLELKKFREILTETFDVLYPCLSSHHCQYDWCHQVLRTSHSLSVERLSQLVSLDRRTLPMCAHVYQVKNKSLVAKNNEEVTIIRYLNETKFSFIYEACGLFDEQNKVFKIEILKKSMSKSIEKKFKNLNVGERILFYKEKLVGDAWRGHVD